MFDDVTTSDKNEILYLYCGVFVLPEKKLDLTSEVLIEKLGMLLVHCSSALGEISYELSQYKTSLCGHYKNHWV